MARTAQRQSAANRTVYCKLSIEDFNDLDTLCKKNCRSISQEIRLALIETGRLETL